MKFILRIQPMKMEQIQCSETSAYNNQTPGKYPKEYIQNTNIQLYMCTWLGDGRRNCYTKMHGIESINICCGYVVTNTSHL